MPRVSAIVVNWNGAADLAVALPSLLAQTYPNLEVIVVDNGSHDESENVARQFGIGWVSLGRNFGLARAMNAGARAASGHELLFLNNDMRFAPDFVARLVEALEGWPEAFAADAKQFSWDGSVVVHCRTVLRAGQHSGWLGPFQVAQAEVDEIVPCVFGSAANLLVRRDRFEALGGWDPSYPIGWEDVDLCLRAWARGWPTIYVPSAVCWHRVGASAETGPGARARLEGTVLGSLRFAMVHLDGSSALRLAVRVVAGTMRDLALRPRSGWARTRALVRLIGDTGRLWRRRRELTTLSSPRERIAELPSL